MVFSNSLVTILIKCKFFLYVFFKKQKVVADILFKEIITEKFPNLGKETDIHIQKVQKFSNKMKPETHTKTHYN